MKDRIIRFMTAEGITSSRLADEIGVQRSSVSHLLSGRNNPSYEFIHKLLSRFPRVNAEWLVMGTGNMYKDMHQAELFNIPPVKKEIPVMSEHVHDNAPLEAFSIEPGDSQIKSSSAVPEMSNSVAGETPKNLSQAPSGRKKTVQVILVYEDNTYKAVDPAE